MTPSHKPVKGLRRMDMSRRTGCNLETIRYYEKIGVMPEPPRAANGYRSYGGEHLSRLNFIMRARRLGFSLHEVRDLLALVDGGMQTCAQVENVAARHLDHVRSKIDDLRRIESELSRTLANCSGDQVPDCAVIEALSEPRS